MRLPTSARANSTRPSLPLLPLPPLPPLPYLPSLSSLKKRRLYLPSASSTIRGVMYLFTSCWMASSKMLYSSPTISLTTPNSYPTYPDSSIVLSSLYSFPR